MPSSTKVAFGSLVAASALLAFGALARADGLTTYARRLEAEPSR